MAKKTVATLQKGGKDMAKLILSEKSAKTGAYTFKEIMVSADKVKDYLK